MDSEKVKPTYEELRRSLETAEKAYRELAVLSYSVAHDLRAPLRSIGGFTKILLEDCSDQLGEDGKGNLRRMQGAGRTMARTIDAFMKLVSLARGAAHRVDVDLSAAAGSIAAALCRGEPSRQAEFVIQPGLKSSGDPRLLDELLENLFANAWKFTSRHPRARIEFGSTDYKGGTAYFVRDDGAGFDSHYAGKLFRPFQRLHRASEFPGIGAGLAIVQSIARLHGGDVAAEGGIEKGATFFFTLGKN
jgi:light-regulated signal transduction histidine kinase (bacteriophytochrome)